MRVPISRDRCRTADDITAYAPIDASASATQENKPSSQSRSRVVLIDSRAIWESVADSVTTTRGSIALSALVIGARAADGSPSVRTKSVVAPDSTYSKGKYKSARG